MVTTLLAIQHVHKHLLLRRTPHLEESVCPGMQSGGVGKVILTLKDCVFEGLLCGGIQSKLVQVVYGLAKLLQILGLKAQHVLLPGGRQTSPRGLEVCKQAPQAWVYSAPLVQRMALIALLLRFLNVYNALRFTLICFYSTLIYNFQIHSLPNIYWA